MLESERRSAYALVYSGEWAAFSKCCPGDEQLGPAALASSPPAARTLFLWQAVLQRHS